MKLMRSKQVDRALVEVIAEHGEELWLKAHPDDGGGCWTGNKRYYESYQPTPEVGDIWTYGNGNDYLVLSVDEKRKQWHMILADKLTNRNPGGPLIRPEIVGERTQTIERATLFTRPLPEERMQLKERPA